MKNVEENIYSILKFKRKKETSEILLCDTYEQLMLHYLNYDLNKVTFLII